MFSAATLNFIDNGGPEPGTVGLSSSGFTGSLDLADRRQWRHDIVKSVWGFFESVPFWRMSPHQDVVSTGYCLAEIDTRYLVYLPEGGVVDVAVEGGSYTVTWINAQDTDDRRPAAPDDTGSRWVAPADGDDWLLYLASKEPP